MTDWLGKVLQDALNPIAHSILGYALILDKNGKCLDKVDNTGHLQDELLLNEEKGDESLTIDYTSTPDIVRMNNKLLVAVPSPFTSYLKYFVRNYIDQGVKKAALLVALGVRCKSALRFSKLCFYSWNRRAIAGA